MTSMLTRGALAAMLALLLSTPCLADDGSTGPGFIDRVMADETASFDWRHHQREHAAAMTADDMAALVALREGHPRAWEQYDSTGTLIPGPWSRSREAMIEVATPFVLATLRLDLLDAAQREELAREWRVMVGVGDMSEALAFGVMQATMRGALTEEEARAFLLPAFREPVLPGGNALALWDEIPPDKRAGCLAVIAHLAPVTRFHPAIVTEVEAELWMAFAEMDRKVQRPELAEKLVETLYAHHGPAVFLERLGAGGFLAPVQGSVSPHVAAALCRASLRPLWGRHEEAVLWRERAQALGVWEGLHESPEGLEYLSIIPTLMAHPDPQVSMAARNTIPMGMAQMAPLLPPEHPIRARLAELAEQAAAQPTPTSERRAGL